MRSSVGVGRTTTGLEWFSVGFMFRILFAYVVRASEAVFELLTLERDDRANFFYSTTVFSYTESLHSGKFSIITDTIVIHTRC